MKVRLLAGVAGVSFGLICLVAGAATAQEAAPQPSQGCSGLGCIFGGGSRQPSPDEARALQDNQRAAEAEQGGKDARDPAVKGRRRQAAGEGADASDDAKSKKKAIHTVTIAADAPEAKKLESLAAALPKQKIKIVKTRHDGDKPNSDFTVSTSIDPAAEGEKAKLFTEKLHIVAGGQVHSVADLQGKVVSFGPDKSAGQLAARRAFEALHVKVDETPLDIDNALDGLATGDVAAVVVLAPQPIAKLKTIKAEGVHLVSWPSGGTMPSGANAATIDSAAYPGLAKPGETIRAVGVDAMLTMSAKGAKQNAAKSFLKALSQNADALTKRGFDLTRADAGAPSKRRVASADKAWH